MSASAHTKDASSMRELVSSEQTTSLTSGAVKDSKSQSLSTLAEVESAAGMRTSLASGKKNTRLALHGAGRTHISGKVNQSYGTGHIHKQNSIHGAKRVHKDKNKCREAFNGIDNQASKQSSEAHQSSISLGATAASAAVHELDDTSEFEGVGAAYDKQRLARRAIEKAKRATEKTKAGTSATKASSKSKGAAKKKAGATGTKKGAASGTRENAAKGATSLAGSNAAQGAAAATAKSATTKTVGAAVASALAPIAGIFAGILAFIACVLIISQLISAIFGFWQNEANKQMMQGLPPYITYELVEAALECQETYGHPAGCTLAQIICESGQGDHMSQLATRDHNLFGIKWASSFAAAPEVTGKASWVTGEVYDGVATTITAYFTSFKSDVDCVRFRSRVFLQQPHFKNQPAIKEAIANHDSDKMAEGLKAGGWATAPEYVEALKSIMDTYNLRRFDTMSVDDFKNMDEKAQKILAAAESQLGVPYVWGGATPNVAFDCSGLTQYCYGRAGISISHNTETQASQLTHIPLSKAQPGDILYRVGHVGIYAGGNDYIHAPHTGDVVKHSSGINSFSYALTYRVV